MATVLPFKKSDSFMTVRELLEDRLREVLLARTDLHAALLTDDFCDLIDELAEEACSALGISEKEQNEPWDTSDDEPEENE